MNFKKIGLITLAVIVGFFVLLFAGLFLYPKDALIAKIEKQVYETTHLKVSIGHLRPALVGIILTDLKVLAEDESQLTLRLDKATLKLKLLPLLNKKLVLSKAILDKPYIQYDLSYTFPESEVEEEPSTSSYNYDIEIDKFLINNAEVRIFDHGKELFSTQIDQQSYAIKTKGAEAFFVQGKINVKELLYHSDYGVLGRGLSPDVDFSVNYNTKQSQMNIETFTINDDSIASSLTGQALLLDDPQFDMHFSASSEHLKQLIAFLPSKLFNAKELRSADGKLNVQFNYKGGADYQKANYDGEFKLSEGVASYKKNIDNIFAHLTFNKDAVNIHQIKANTEKSYVDMQGNITNYAKGADAANIRMSAKYKVDFNELSAMQMLPKGQTLTGAVQGDMSIANQIAKPSLSGKTEFKNVSYKSSDMDSVEVKQLDGVLLFSEKKIDFNIPKMMLNADTLTIKGHLDNAVAYALADKPLGYVMDVQADSFNLNPFMQGESSTEASEPIDFEFLKKFNGQISFLSKTVKYEDLILKNVSGLIQTQQGHVFLKDIKSNVFSGLVTANFDLDTSSKNTYPYSAKLNVDKVEINELLKYTKNYFPIDISKTTKIGGELFSQISSSGKINQATLMPELNSISFAGPVKIAQGYLKQSSLQNKMAQFLKKESLKSFNFKSWKQYLEFDDGKFHIKDIALNNDNFDVSGSGTQSLDGKLDYAFKVKLPKEEVKHLLSMSIDANDKEKDVTLPLSVTGTLDGLKISLDQSYIKDNVTKKIEKTIETKVEKKIEKKVEKKKEEVKDNVKEKLKGKLKGLDF